jgi:hypothetical protein
MVTEERDLATPLTEQPSPESLLKIAEANILAIQPVLG